MSGACDPHLAARHSARSNSNAPSLTRASAPRLALRKEEAAAALGISNESFDRYVKPYVGVVRWGSLRVYPLAELERVLAEQAAAPLEEA